MPQSKTDFHGYLKHYTHVPQSGRPKGITNNNQQLKNKQMTKEIPGMEFILVV